MNRQYNFRGLSILIVDDNHFGCQTIASMCYGFGFEKIIKTTDATEALEIMKTQKVDFIVCDINMRPVDGIEFVRFVRLAPDSADSVVPIIMLTGNTEAWRVAAARDAGATEFVAKPVSAELLLSRIVHIIEHPRSFVQSRSFAGPDRRRRSKDVAHPNRRGGANGE